MKCKRNKPTFANKLSEYHSLLYQTNIPRPLTILADFILDFNALTRQARSGFLSRLRGQDHKKEIEYLDDLISFLRNTNRELNGRLYVQKWLDDGKAKKHYPHTRRVLQGVDASRCLCWTPNACFFICIRQWLFNHPAFRIVYW